MNCGVCYEKIKSFQEMSSHIIQQTEQNDSAHVKFLNQYITKKKLSTTELEEELANFYATPDGLQLWVKKIFVQKFYSDDPHPFVVALQHPSKSTLLGYVVEHQHFLRQWVKSCAYIMAKTNEIDVIHYELENINTEFGGLPPDIPSHYERLLDMGESLGMNKEQVLAVIPLPQTAASIKFWNSIAETRHWVETMIAMHGLELIAYRDIKKYGASMTYFDPEILDSKDISEETKLFLREGYEADIGHADEALTLAETYIEKNPDLSQPAQATFLQSIEMFDKYLLARLERGKMLE